MDNNNLLGSLNGVITNAKTFMSQFENKTPAEMAAALNVPEDQRAQFEEEVSKSDMKSHMEKLKEKLSEFDTLKQTLNGNGSNH